MKPPIFSCLFFALFLATFVMTTGCSPQNTNAGTPPTSPPVVNAAPAPAALEANTMNATSAAAALEPPAALPTPAPLPSNISPTSPLAQVVRLTQADVDQGIIMVYITNSSRTFNLDSDTIIYLSDLGVPSNVVTAMMQRDQFLQQQFAEAQAAQQAQQVQPAQVAPPAETVPSNTAEVEAPPEAQPAPVTVNYFYDTLSPYGSWVMVNGYGRCWRPTVCVYNSGWQPYCDRGHWVYTDCGWYWSSDYAWGVTFHYGRWFRDASFGWCWYPDTVWAPSWVTWRYSNNYCGWAPLPPRTYCQAGVGIVYQGGGVSVGFNFGLGASCFTFVPTQYFCNPHPRTYCASPSQAAQIYNNTTVINNINVHGRGNHQVVINNGIPVKNITTVTQTPVQPVPVHEADNFAHGHHNQPFDRPGYVPAQNPTRSGFVAGNGNNYPGAPEASAQNRVPKPVINQNTQIPPEQFTHGPAHAQSGHNDQLATTPQRSWQSVQAPAAGYYPQPAPVRRTQPDSSQDFTRYPTPRQSVAGQNPVVAPPANYAAPGPAQPRQNYSPPRVVAAPQPGAPSFAAAPPQPQQGQGGGRGWGQNWQGH